MEIWKDIQGYEGRYQVSNLGRVKSISKGVVMKPFICGSGYQELILLNGERKPKLLHRLVAEAFIPNAHGKKEVNHKDGDKFNNRADNLEWVTPSENQMHSHRVLGNKCSNPRKVICIETKQVYESMKCAAQAMCLQASLIWKCCNGEQNTTGGYHWQYAE